MPSRGTDASPSKVNRWFPPSQTRHFAECDSGVAEPQGKGPSIYSSKQYLRRIKAAFRYVRPSFMSDEGAHGLRRFRPELRRVLSCLDFLFVVRSAEQIVK